MFSRYFSFLYFLYEHAKHQSALEIAHMMPSIFRTIAVALGSGLTLSQSIEYVSKHTEGVVSENFYIADMQIKCGFPIEEAIEDLAERLDAPGVNLLASALVISHRTGSPLKSLLQKTAELVELQEKNQRLIATKTAQVRLSARIVCLLPVVFIDCLVASIAGLSKGFIYAIGRYMHINCNGHGLRCSFDYSKHYERSNEVMDLLCSVLFATCIGILALVVPRQI